MSAEDREDKTIYKVVVNHEEQYSIWPADRDMRPLSLRKKIEEMEKQQGN